jgi:UDP-N-acetylmuramoyl-tripeptide--D-alanyl-D-alanine ligase
VIGVTGSAGKTSTTGMLLAMLGTTGFGTTANLNNLLGVPLTVLGIRPAAHTAGIVIEAGMSEPGELTLSAQIIQPDIALVTNVLPAHLTGLGNIAAIAHEKSELPRYARTGAAAVFPADCLRYPSFRNLPCHAFPVSFATETPENTTAAAPSKNATPLSAFFDEIPTGGYHITLRSNPATDIDFFMPPCTKGMAHNAALAAVTARLAGVPPARIRKTLLQWKPSALRGELRTHNGRLFYIDCYNANPASVLDAANTFDHLTRDSDTRLFVLAGMNEMGPHSANLHEETGRALPLRTGDTLLLFGGDSTSIGTGAIAAGFPPSSILSLPDITAVRTAIHSSHAPVFLKGSRSYALERTLPWTPMPPH